MAPAGTKRSLERALEVAALGEVVASLPWEPAGVEEQSSPFIPVPGRVVGLEGPTGLGLTRLGMAMLAESSRQVPVAVVDVRGWVCPLAAWEVGVRADHLTVLRCQDRQTWPKAMAALIEGVRTIYAEVPEGVGDQVLRRLAALARARDGAVILRPLAGALPAGIAHLRVKATGIEWIGAEAGHGRLEHRRVRLELSGKGAAGMRRRVEVEDDGTHAVRVVSGLAAQTAGRAVG